MLCTPSISSQARIRRAPGFVMLDAVVALTVVISLIISFTVVLGQQRRATAAISDTNLAQEKAEAALLNLRAGTRGVEELHTVDGDHAVTLIRTPDSAAPGYAWVKARAVVGRSTAEVYGLVPDAAASSLSNLETR